MEEYLTPKQVRKEYGYSRDSLLNWEGSGALGPVARTPGRQRRYTRAQLESVIKAEPVDTSAGPDKPAPGQAGSGRPNSALYRELGGTGLTRFGGSVVEERLRELQGRPGWLRYREMRLNDPVIAAVFFGLTNALKQPSKRVIPASDSEADKACAEFVDQCLDDMSFTWQDTMDLVLNPMFETGFSLCELVYKKRLGPEPPLVYDPEAKAKISLPPSRYSDGRIGWRKWAPRTAESLADGNEWVFDDHGGIRGINQQLDYDYTETKPLAPQDDYGWQPDAGLPPQPVVSIPIEKLLHFRTTLHPANNPEGQSLLRGMWQAYWYTTNLQEIEGIGAERDLAGIPVIYLGEGTTLGSDPNSDWSIAKDIVVNLRNDEQTGVVIPHPKLGSGTEGRGVLLELLSTGGRRNWDVGAIIERYDKRKALSVLAQFIMLGMQQVGSYALSSHQGDLFVLAAQAFLNAVAGVINRHAITRLIQLNHFPDITGLPQLAFAPVGIPKLEELSNFVNRLVEREVLTPDAELERHLRQVAGLPAAVVNLDQPNKPAEAGGRDAEKTALLLRRMSLAVKPLQDLGVMGADEAGQILRPLLDELKTSLGADPTLPGITEAAFGRQVEAAKSRLNYDLAMGVSLQKAGQRYIRQVTGLKKNRGAVITTTLETALAGLYRQLVADIEAGEIPAIALQMWRQAVDDELAAAITAAWIAGREAGGEAADEENEAGYIQPLILNASGYLSNFTEEMIAESGELPDGGAIIDLLNRRESRMEMYAGEAWASYNAGKVFGKKPDSWWIWEGPDDERSCSICSREVNIGPRRLSDITVMPGRDTECRTRCRHELVEVKAP